MTIPQTIIVRNDENLDYIQRHGRLATRDQLNAKIRAIWNEYGVCYLISGGVTVALSDIGGGQVWGYCGDAEGLLAYRAVDVNESAE